MSPCWSFLVVTGLWAPSVLIPDGKPGAGGYREHDILVIKENGVEDITKFPFGPEHNIIK